MTTRQFSYDALITTTATANATVRFDQSIQFNSLKSEKRIKLVNCYISGQIPNIYNYGGVNNGLIRVSNDGGSTWTNIQLEDGIYTASEITNAINYSVSDWVNDMSDPPIVIVANTVVSKCYVVLDSTKLAVGTQIGIDFSQSLIYDVLGYDIGACTFITDDRHEATNLAKLDYFGNTMSIDINGFGPISIVNGRSTYTIATINLSQTQGNLYYLDTASFFPITIFPSSQISSFTLSFKGSRLNSSGNYKDIIFKEGEIHLTFQLMEVNV